MRLKARLNSSKLIKVVLLIGFVMIVTYYIINNTHKIKEQFTESAIFTNDNNVSVLLTDHPSSAIFKTRDGNEVFFRKITTFLINNGTIKDNIIDLGAWIGDNSIPWAMNIDATVYAIDPSSDNYYKVKIGLKYILYSKLRDVYELYEVTEHTTDRELLPYIKQQRLYLLS
jgi:hypothetical protein